MKDLAGWPNREWSRFVRAGGLEWHVQVAGEGPVLLMLHGTGAATHSWRGLLPLLTAHFTVVAPDLPGHGYTDAPATSRLSLPGMARALQTLLWTLDLTPVLAAGHSAGAPILVRMLLDGQVAPRGLIGLNGALLPLGGMAGQLFSPLAKLLTGLPGLPDLFAWRARDRGVVERLLAATGSRVDAEGVRLYQRVVTRRSHAAAALGMMAHWDLPSLTGNFARIEIPVLLIAGENDRTVPPTQSEEVAAQVQKGRYVGLPGLGHLAHEEDPAAIANLIDAFAAELGIL
ncbi:MAG: alpha/beta fold hydrolase [Acetobacteraceae bacterium]|nr:alpha/beta fold hydrolase [Acetobacteraceae bacterium]